ncbi:RNA methyltransferase [Microbacterium sp. X-17]|uniref:TrmH family RNA methyltransferase n=1 Tax=Microbacterium sp. X-17 TaxID=3144404 RepID=UPI0031F50864
MRIERIERADDPRLRDYRDLTDTALRRALEPAGGLYIAESAKVIARALAAGHAPRSVLVQERWLDEVAELLGAAAASGGAGAADVPAGGADVPVYLVDAEIAEGVTGYAVHRGALAAMHRPELASVASVVAGARRVLVLDDLVDHTNVGAAFRAAAGLGADAVLVGPRCADPLYRRSVRVSMGTVFQVPWTRLPAWDEARGLLHAEGFRIAALALAPDAVPLDEFAADPPERIALVLGAEGDGLSRRALAAADTVVTIPMTGGVDSLNVAAASAVALWALRTG